MWRGVMRSEWTKFFSNSWCILGIIVSLLIPSVIILITGSSQASKDVLGIYFRALYLAQVGIITSTAIFFGEEYTHSNLRTTLLSVPSRARYLGTKFVVISFIILLTGICSGVLGFIVVTIQTNSGFTIQGVVEFIGKLILILLSWLQLGWITASLSIIFKSYIVPIATVVPLILGLSQLLFLLSDLAKFLPDLATINLFLVTNVSLFLGMGSGILVQFIWGITLGSTAIWLFFYRDVR